MKCHWCGSDPCLEPRIPKNSDLVSCPACREIDRLRGIANLILSDQHQNLLNDLRVFNSRTRDWSSNRFGGPPADYQALPPQPEVSLSQSIKARPPEPSGPPPNWVHSDRSDAPVRHIASTELGSRSSLGAAPVEAPAATATASGSRRKRDKNNKGKHRESWKRARSAIYRSREDCIGRRSPTNTLTRTLIDSHLHLVAFDAPQGF